MGLPETESAYTNEHSNPFISSPPQAEVINVQPTYYSPPSENVLPPPTYHHVQQASTSSKKRCSTPILTCQIISGCFAIILTVVVLSFYFWGSAVMTSYVDQFNFSTNFDDYNTTTDVRWQIGTSISGVASQQTPYYIMLYPDFYGAQNYFDTLPKMRMCVTDPQVEAYAQAGLPPDLNALDTAFKLPLCNSVSARQSDGISFCSVVDFYIYVTSNSTSTVGFTANFFMNECEPSVEVCDCEYFFDYLSILLVFLFVLIVTCCCCCCSCICGIGCWIAFCTSSIMQCSHYNSAIESYPLLDQKEHY